MRRLERVWPALEAIAGLAGIPATWREHLGDEADAVAGFLRPTDQRASKVSMPEPRRRRMSTADHRSRTTVRS